MNRQRKMKIFFCTTILFGLINTIKSNEHVLDDMSLEERRYFFETEDGSIPEYKVVEVQLPSRSKRSNLQRLRLFLDGRNLTVMMRVVEDDDLINRSVTGVWTAVRDSSAYQGVQYYPLPEALEQIGDITFFQNFVDGSAVTRFTDKNDEETILGILWHDYIVKSLPTEYVHAIRKRHVLERRSVNSANDQDKKLAFVAVFKNTELSKRYVRDYNHAKRAVLTHHRLHKAKRHNRNATRRLKVVYPKLLVIPDAGVVRHYPNNLALLRQLIAQFHFASAMFRELEAPEVHLNIAGFIIPSNESVTPYIVRGSCYNDSINAVSTANKATLHFSQEIRRFPKDWWDSIVILTRNTIARYCTRLDGYSEEAKGCTGSAAIATLSDTTTGAQTLARVLEHMFSSSDHLHPDFDSPSDGIMSHTQLDSRLEWSEDRYNASQIYFRSDAAKCTYPELQAIPDEWTSMPGSWLTLDGQCDNICADCEGHCVQPSYDPNDCAYIGCKKHGDCHERFFEPLLGSTLDNPNATQLCGNWKWESTTFIRRFINVSVPLTYPASSFFLNV